MPGPGDEARFKMDAAADKDGGIPVHAAKLTRCDTEKCGATTVSVCRYDGFSCPEVLTSKPPPPSPPCEPWTKVQQLWYIPSGSPGHP